MRIQVFYDFGVVKQLKVSIENILEMHQIKVCLIDVYLSYLRGCDLTEMVDVLF